MAGTFISGEAKTRPGSYFRIDKKGNNAASGIMNGVTAVIFKADFGPLNTAVELNAADGYEKTFGNGLTTDAVREAVAGGAKTIIACRVGNGGAQGTACLADTNGEDALRVTARWPGDKEFSITVREKLSDSAVKECIFYAGTTEFEKVDFPSGAGEANALAEALASSRNFKAEVLEGKEGALLGTVLQSAFTKGSNPDRKSVV